jgi:hypothetical protein
MAIRELPFYKGMDYTPPVRRGNSIATKEGTKAAEEAILEAPMSRRGPHRRHRPHRGDLAQLLGRHHDLGTLRTLWMDTKHRREPMVRLQQSGRTEQHP